MKFSAGILSFLSTASIASAAYAIDIDFTSIPPGADGASEWSTTVDGVTVTVTPGPGTELSWDAQDGFGVSGGGYENDEIEGDEVLTVTFTDSTGAPVEVELVSFEVSDLFKERSNFGFGRYDEVGNYQVDGQATVGFTPKHGVTGYSKPNGEGTVLVGESTTTLALTAPGYTKWSKHKKWFKQDHEFALGGISFEVVSTPELGTSGAAAAALLLGGLGMVLKGRRRRLAGTAA
jgi:hypothetical protein